MKIAIIGASGGTHLGGSIKRAATAMGIEVVWFDVTESFRGPRPLPALSWRLARHRPLRLGGFSARVVETCARVLPQIMIVLGAGSLTATAIRKLQSLEIICAVFSSDDPWNATARSDWYMRALPAYNVVFTPRRANMADFWALGCGDVRYLPFAYDDELFRPAGEVTTSGPDVLFVGGADRGRVEFMVEFLRSGLRTGLAGSFWDRFAATRAHALGIRGPHEICAMTAAAKVNLCLVRRSNRDGHVMRSFEIAAAAGCMLAEDTQEHREIFGPDGQTVVYFGNAREAAERASWLVKQPGERARLAAALHARVAGRQNTYVARLETMLEAANGLRARDNQPQLRLAAQ